MGQAPVETYDTLATQLRRTMDLRDIASSDHARLLNNTMPEAEVKALAARVQAETAGAPEGSPDANVSALFGDLLATSGTGIGVLERSLEGFLLSRLNGLESEITRLTQRLENANPQRAVDDPLWQANTAFEDEVRLRGVLSPAGPARLAPQLIQGPGGKYAYFDPNNPGAGPITGQIPGWEERPSLIVDIDKNGNLVAIDPLDPLFRKVLVENFAFPEIDPERVFVQTQLEFDTSVEQFDRSFAEGARQFDEQLAIQRQQVAGQFVGLELDRRGQMIDALTQDMAFQIEIGRMTFEEANLQLARVNTALDQRRAEREQALQFAVTKASIRTLPSGEQVTRLPFAEELASILTQTTGQPFSADLFDLPVGAIDPEQAGQDVLRSSAFGSPIPALTESLNSSRAMISSILGASIGTALTAETAATAITEGM